MAKKQYFENLLGAMQGIDFKSAQHDRKSALECYETLF